MSAETETWNFGLLDVLATPDHQPTLVALACAPDSSNSRDTAPAPGPDKSSKGQGPPTEKRKEELTQKLIKQYVVNSSKATTTWIKNFGEAEQNFLRALVKKLDAYWATSLYGEDSRRAHGRDDLRELYEIYKREFLIEGTCPPQPGIGSDPFALSSPFLAVKKGGLHYTTVRIITRPTPLLPIQRNKTQAKTMPSFVNESHKNAEGTDELWKVDLGIKYSGEKNNLVWFGPAHPFKVLAVAIFQGNSQEIPEYHGSRITIEILPEDGKTQPHVLWLVHFTAINLDIYEGTGEIFKAGTFLGMTTRCIGAATGPHLHITAAKDTSLEDGGFTREKIYKLWTGK